MDYLKLYRERMSANGSSVGDSFRKNTHYFQQTKFTEATTYRRARIYTNVGTNKMTSVEEDIRVIEIDRQGSLRNILFRPLVDYEVGCMIEFNNSQWLAYDKFGSNIDSIKLRVSRINDTLKWKSKDGVIQEIPSVTSTSYLGSGSKANDAGLSYNVFDVRTPVGKILISVELNEVTETLKLGQRFICGKGVYELEHIDDISTVDSNYHGVLQLSLKTVIIHPKDDFETGVAYNSIWEDKEEVEKPEEGSGW